MLLEGRKILVTGAGRGLGKAIAIACAQEGASVAVHFHRSEDGAREVCSQIEKNYGRTAVLARFDVKDTARVKEETERVAKALGGLDGWVQNAGIQGGGLLLNGDPETWKSVLDTNVFGALVCAQAALPSLLAAKKSGFVFVSSVASQRPFRGQTAYAASKGAVEALTRAMAVEYARKGLRVHCVRPGPIRTEMLSGSLALGEKELLERVPMKRISEPEEVAAFVVFLLSERAGYSTGGVHDVDGGYRIA